MPDGPDTQQHPGSTVYTVSRPATLTSAEGLQPGGNRMLRTSQHLIGVAIAATDGDIGRVVDVYFDHEHWALRYLVVDTGTWLSSRRVLVAPWAFAGLDADERRLAVSLSRAQVRDSPDAAAQGPISRRHELEFHAYYGYQPYWLGADPWLYQPLPGAPLPPAVPMPPDMSAGQKALRPSEENDVRLRSVNETAAYHVKAIDGAIGHVEDFLIDDETWAIRYLVVDTSKRWMGRRVVVSIDWISSVSESDRVVAVGLTRKVIEECPEYDPDRPIEPAYAARWSRHYERPPYWPGD